MKVSLTVGPHTNKTSIGRLKNGFWAMITKGAQTSIHNVIWLKITILNVKWKYPFFHLIQSEHFTTTEAIENYKEHEETQ